MGEQKMEKPPGRYRHKRDDNTKKGLIETGLYPLD
jgi:hypothetical protein